MDLGLLFKSSFKAFLKSKWILALLGGIVFATIGVFTLLFAVSNNMNDTLQTHMTVGKVHDFTVDERYSPSKDPLISASLVNDSGGVKTYQLNYKPYDRTTDGDQDVNALYYMRVVPDKTIVTTDVVPSITNEDDAVTYFRALILRAYEQQKRVNFVSAVKLQVPQVQTLQASQSMLVYSDLNTYKFVWSQGAFTDPTDKRVPDQGVDRIVLSQGENISMQQLRAGGIDCNSEALVEYTNPFATTPSSVPAWTTCIYNGETVGGTSFLGVDALAAQRMAGSSEAKYTPNNLSKGYEIVIKDRDISPITGGAPVAIHNFTSYEAIVSPAYAAANGIVPVSHSALFAGVDKAIDPDQSLHYDTMTRTLDNWKGLEKSTITVGGTKFVVVGVGTTPDYAYPIMGVKDPSVNVNTQAVVFVNKPGIERIYDIFAGSDTETYLTGRFTPGADKSVSAVNKVAAEYMSVDASSSPAKLIDQAGSNLASIRISTLAQIADSISKVTIVVVTVMLALAAFILAVVIKRQITANRTTLGILEANGFPKAVIALSFSTIAAIVCLIPPLLGYIVGFFTQVTFFSAFASFWTLPAGSPEFSVPLMLLLILAPVLVTGLIAFLVALWTLRGRIIDNVNDVTKQNSFGASLSYLFGWLDIKSRYALAIFTNNILKMFIIGGAITASITAVSVAAASVNKLEDAKAQTRAVHKYSYKLDLATPTEQGGQYGVFDYDLLGKGAVSTKDQLDSIPNPTNGQTVFVADEVTYPDGFYVFSETRNYWEQQGADYAPKNDYLTLNSYASLNEIVNPQNNSVVRVEDGLVPGTSQSGFYVYDASNANWVKQNASYQVTVQSPVILDDPDKLLKIGGALNGSEIKISGAPISLINGYYTYDATTSAWSRTTTWDSDLRPVTFEPPDDSSVDWARSESWTTSPFLAFQNGNKGGFGGSVAIAACGNEQFNFCNSDLSLGVALDPPFKPTKLVDWYGQNHQIQYKGILSQGQEGIASAIATPSAWSLAENLLPENQRNSFNNNYTGIVTAFQNEVGRQAEAYRLSSPTPSAEQVRAKINSLEKIYDPTNFLAPYLARQLGIDAFVVGYNQVGFDAATDMLYSHADGYFGNFTDRNLATATTKFVVTGINPDDAGVSKFYSLPSDFKASTAPYADAVKAEGIATKAVVPVYINKFMVDKYGYKTGDTINFNIENTIDADRLRVIDHAPLPTVPLRVVGVVNTYQGNEIITSQQNVNIVLQRGMQPSTDRLVSFNGVDNDGKTTPTNFFNNVPYFFNGVMSTAKTPLALSTLNIYAPSGFYPAASTLQKGGVWNGLARQQFYVYPETYYSLSALKAAATRKDGAQAMVVRGSAPDSELGLYEYNSANTEPWSKVTDVAQSLKSTPYGTLLAKSGIDSPLAYEDVFGTTPYSSIVTSSVDVAQLSANVFDQVSTFIGVMLWTILGITVFISVVFTLIMAISIIEDNKKNIATLKVLGYKNGEIASIFTRGYLTPLVLAAAAAAPLAILLTYLIRQFIVYFGGITAPIEIVGWEVPVAVVFVLLCFAGLFAKTLISMRAQSALLALR